MDSQDYLVYVFGIRVVSAESFKPGLFRPMFGVGRFGLGSWVVSAHFQGVSFRLMKSKAFIHTYFPR